MPRVRTELPITFRVYPERNRKLYYQVFIFPNRRQMYLFRDEQHRSGAIGYRKGHGKGSNRFLAICQSWITENFGPRGGMTLGRSIGEILFAVPYIGAGVVSHEMTHAAIRWGANKGIDGRKVMSEFGRDEERICLAQGHMVRQFWNHWWKHEEAKKKAATGG